MQSPHLYLLIARTVSGGTVKARLHGLAPMVTVVAIDMTKETLSPVKKVWCALIREAAVRRRIIIKSRRPVPCGATTALESVANIRSRDHRGARVFSIRSVEPLVRTACKRFRCNDHDAQSSSRIAVPADCCQLLGCRNPDSLSPVVAK